MVFSTHRSVLLNDMSYLSLAKRDIRLFAESLGFSGSKLGEIEIIVSEITSNLVKHTNKGREILYKQIEKDGAKGIEIIAIDNGPGMKDSQHMLKDGISTTATLGQGLGAIRRLSHEFDIFSLHGWGTILLSRYYLKSSISGQKNENNDFEINAITVPKPGEKACGDGYAFKKTHTGLHLLAIDGLGHGPDAEEAARVAIKVFMNTDEKAPNDLLFVLHEQLVKTRGAVGSILEISFKEGDYLYCGIGNIQAGFVNISGFKSLSSYNGILGMNKPSRIQNQRADIESKEIFIITSDGIKSHWDHSIYPGILSRDGSIIAAAIYKDNARRTDDSLVMILRIKTLR